MRNKILSLILKFLRILFGASLFALGSSIIIRGKIGVAQWDVLHQGLANLLNISIGLANISLSFTIIIINIFLGQNIGWATVINMISTGIFMNLFLKYDFIPIPDLLYIKITMLFLGIILQGLGTFSYVSPGLGAGPRDGLYVGLGKKTNKSFGFIKTLVEICVVATGYVLGGNFGIGTLIMAFSAGYIWQYMYKLMGFNISNIKHRYIQDDILFIREKISKSKSF